MFKTGCPGQLVVLFERCCLSKILQVTQGRENYMYKDSKKKNQHSENRKSSTENHKVSMDNHRYL